MFAASMLMSYYAYFLGMRVIYALLMLHYGHSNINTTLIFETFPLF